MLLKFGVRSLGCTQSQTVGSQSSMMHMNEAEILRYLEGCHLTQLQRQTSSSLMYT